MKKRFKINEQNNQDYSIVGQAYNIGCLKQFEVENGGWFIIDKSRTQPHKLTDGTNVISGKNKKGNTIYFYDDGWAINQDDKTKKGRWIENCPGLELTKSKTANPENMTADQKAYVDDIVKTEAVHSEKPSDYEIDRNAWEVIDLNTRKPSLFPIPGIFFVYKKKGLLNVTKEQQDIIISDYEKQGWLDEEPDATKIDLYVPTDLKKEHPKYFSTSYIMWQPISKIKKQDFELLMTDIENTFDSQKVDKDQCKEVIKMIYLAYEKGYSFPDDATRLKFVTYAKRCLRQGVVPRRVRNMKNTLLLIPKYDPRTGTGSKLSLKEDKITNLDNIIKKTLMEASENKKKLLQEEKIISSRFNFILENMEPKTKQGRDEIYMNILSEMIYLDIQGFDKKVISEQVEGVFGVLSNLFGRSSGAIADTFKEKGVQWIIERLGFGGNSYMKNFLITSLGNVNIMDVPKLFTNCEFLTKKIAETIPEAYLRKLEYQKGIGGMFTDVVRNTLYDVIRESSFAQKLEASIAKIVCPLVTKLTGMFSNKLSGMKTKLVGA